MAHELNGIFPDNYKELLKLKGIGEYTAAAIASFSYNEPVAVLDGNVYRVLSRYFNMDNDISDTKTKKVFQTLAQEVLLKDNPAIFNQAIMEFGALQCVPKNPDCESCVLSNSCAALQYNKVAQLPVKSKKTKVTPKYFNYLILKDITDKFIVQKREGKGIWENLYEFPLFETAELMAPEVIEKQLIQMDFFGQKAKEIILLNSEIIKHKLSHQHLFIRFFLMEFDVELPGSKGFKKKKKLPFPIVIHNFMLSNYFNSH